MSINAPLAGFGQTDINKVAAKAGERPQPPSKYKDFMDSLHSVAYSKETINQQTELEWTNIEGEVMGLVLVQDLLSGTMMQPVKNRMFRFKEPKKQLDLIFVTKFIETLHYKHPQLVPAITTGTQALNELMVSYLRHGRIELVEMLKAFQVQMQDTQSQDNKLIRR